MRTLLTACLTLLAATIAVAPLALAATGATTSPLEPIDETKLSIAPATFPTTRVEPGDTLRLTLDVRNHTGGDVSLRPIVLPLRGSREPGTLAQAAARDSRSGAAVAWVEFPFERWPRLATDTQLRIPVEIRVPSDARPGTYALAIGVRQRVTPPGIGGVESNEARVVASAAPVSRVVIDVAGEASAELQVDEVESPRVVWGGSPTTFRATVINTGDTVLEVDGEVQLGAFVGTASRDLGTEAREVLPDGATELELRWRDPPLLGWYEPTLVVVGGEGSGMRVERTLPTVWALPPWWVLVLLVVATWLPVRAIRRRRRRARR